ncbi:MAG: prephenate dehydrogenase [Clostridia bacterium]|nr:prephenate dehydrogenase [Clostridia bacterium]MBO7288822.1 prephenate dehydrogenase [Clostridia bacterium]
MSKSNILIVGLGLIGGSYAKALKRLGYHISAIDKDEETIEYALKEKIIDEGSVTIDENIISSADAVIFALYPDVFKKWICDNQKYFKPGALITDVTGVKSCVVYDIQNILRDDAEFIAAHPMAGREVYGVKNSDDAIFRGANYIVTPTDKNTEGAVEWCKTLGRILGFANISVLSPEEHDKIIGFVSQLTHVIAVSLMTCNDNTDLVSYTGDSFRDLTRIARINENMWSELFMLNKDVLLEQMDIFINEFKLIRNMLNTGDKEALCDKMRLSTLRRSYFDKR